MTKSATNDECMQAVQARRVVLVNGAAYLDGAKVLAPRIARQLEAAYAEATKL